MNKVRINSKIYAQAFQEGWIDSLAIYVHLAKVHSGKSFYFKTGRKTDAIKSIADKSSISFSTLCRHLNVLKKNNLVHIFKNEIKLATNKEMQVKTRKYVYVPDTVNILKEIKDFLKSIPIITNLKRQQKAIGKIEHYIRLRCDSESQNSKISNKERKKLDEYKKKGGRFEYNPELTLSYKGIENVIGVKNRNKVARLKRLLSKAGVLSCFNETVKLFDKKVDVNTFNHLKVEGIIPNNTFFYKGNVYAVKPTVYLLKYLDVPTPTPK